jgi:hypothetical protein
MASGYLIATRFNVLYAAALASGRYVTNPATSEPVYGIPHRSRPVPPQGMPQYRGIDRDPPDPDSLSAETDEANLLLPEILSAADRTDGWVTAEKDILRVWNALGARQAKYEIIFGKEWEDAAEPPPGAQFLGCDAAYFASDHFSCICDALFIPLWHGTDPEGTLFKEYFCRLNTNGLFNSNDEALEYLRYYLGFDWTEHDDRFTSIEVYVLQNP